MAYVMRVALDADDSSPLPVRVDTTTAVPVNIMSGMSSSIAINNPVNNPVPVAIVSGSTGSTPGGSVIVGNAETAPVPVVQPTGRTYRVELEQSTFPVAVVTLAGGARVTNSSGEPVPVAVQGSVNANLVSAAPVPVYASTTLPVGGTVSVVTNSTSLRVQAPYPLRAAVPSSGLLTYSFGWSPNFATAAWNVYTSQSAPMAFPGSGVRRLRVRIQAVMFPNEVAVAQTNFRTVCQFVLHVSNRTTAFTGADMGDSTNVANLFSGSQVFQHVTSSTTPTFMLLAGGVNIARADVDEEVSVDTGASGVVRAYFGAKAFAAGGNPFPLTCAFFHATITYLDQGTD